MLRVRDIMTTHVFALSTDSSLDQAQWSFAVNEISGAPVRDPQGRLVGVISKSDLVDPMRHDSAHHGTVGEAMTPAVWAVHPDDPVMEAVRLMVEKSIHRVLVVRGPGQLEGIVTAMSVLRALAGGGDFAAGVDLGDNRSSEDVVAENRRRRVDKI
jgi:predicted transcriptional regulator